MDYEVKISEQKTYVYVRPHKNVTKRLAESYTRDATEMGLKHGIHRLLVDHRGISSVSGTLGKYEFAYENGQKVGLTLDWKIALLRDKDAVEIQFLETVMRNAGYDFRIFTKKEQAIDWLEEKQTNGNIT
jgi:hypothetical protein